MESMTNAPYLLPNLRNGARLGNTTAEDSIIRDGLWDPYKDFHMGNAAELCAVEFSLSREKQDAFAIESYARANKAIAAGTFEEEISAVEVKVGRDTVSFKVDEEPGKAKPDKIPTLKPVFQKDGTVTAANASSINDGAAALLVCSESFAKHHNLTPLARIVGTSSFGQAPEWFTTAPVGAVETLMARTKTEISKVDLFEINEAFSAVALACSQKLKIDENKLNINGGAVALGHPIGASGARILTTLLYSLKRHKLKSGVAAICNGGGEATAMLVERI
jgi:acetyl-CoA C-acetyltransferase